MSARDVIARACFDPGKFVGPRRDGEGSDQWRARAALEALTAAGWRLVGPDEVDPDSLKAADLAVWKALSGTPAYAKPQVIAQRSLRAIASGGKQ